ncbi:MAG: outer membrane protein assembly factor BamE [Acidobacteriota bacterium]
MTMIPLEQLRNGAGRLQPGMQKAQVVKELGTPSSETEMMGKQSKESSGIELSYYVYRESPTLVNEKKDKWLSLYFDRSGGLVHAYTTIPELELDPRLRMPAP